MFSMVAHPVSISKAFTEIYDRMCKTGLGPVPILECRMFPECSEAKPRG